MDQRIIRLRCPGERQASCPPEQARRLASPPPPTPFLVKQPQGRLRRRERHLAEPKGAHEWIFLDLVNPLLPPRDDPRLRPAEEFVAAEKYQIDPGRNTRPRQGFILKTESCEVDQRARA